MWIFKGKEFTELDIPKDAIGFIYEMSAIIDGKTVRYIGKKNFYANVKKKLGKRALALVTDKRLKKYTREMKADFMNYYSSNKILKDAHKKGIVIKREMLLICYSSMQLTYEEVRHQFLHQVLEKEEYLNGNILGRFYKTK